MKLKDAAELLDISIQKFRVFIRAGKFDYFAECIKNKNGNYSYYVNEERLMMFLGKKKVSEETAISTDTSTKH